MMLNRCVNKLQPDLIKEETTPDEAIEYIKRNTSEMYEMPEGFTIKGISILGKPPLYVGLKLKRKEIVFYFKKPCFGTYLMKVKGNDEDLAKIREEGKRIK
ncbi:hypothetical protein J2128_001864 [Methanomicrobium sp. W14]|uniref:DUF1894 domain-containing protein n=1 Tax=Methanomicrobium sp. W14 TaxID=2817839 RepID=UPI001FD9B69B|nr:DUF1894 domain-containing protein [Methanomicrobium sp. W14]MBP2133910.1 hypothetical protein [Methanomicrobium sp. W14]